MKKAYSKGGRDLLKYRNKEIKKLTPQRAIFSKCYECTNEYLDGRYDCEIPECPLYPYMPYKHNKPPKFDWNE